MDAASGAFPLIKKKKLQLKQQKFEPFTIKEKNGSYQILNLSSF